MSDGGRTVAPAWLVAAATIVAVSGCGKGPVTSQTAAHPSGASALPPTGSATSTPHVMVVVEENKGYGATLGSCGDDPYWCSLASTYATATSWFAVSHPSLPNYLALDSGSTQGCASDRCETGYTAPDLGGQLSAAGIPWRAYMESMPSPCYSGSVSGGYARKHNPFAYFTDNASTCNVEPYPVTGLATELASSDAPDFVWVTPGLDNDMHDGTVQQGNSWLRSNIGPVLGSPWFAANGTVIVTMDENDADGAPDGGQVPMVVISSRSSGHGAVPAYGNHDGLLRSIEETFGLALLGGATNSRNGDVAALFG